MQKSEKFLIVTAVFMFALILGYNAFFVPEIKVSLPDNQTTNEEKFDKNTDKSIGKVNINTANAEELQTLKGVGKVTAKNIIEYRETNGGFESIAEIMEIKGIGEKIFEKLKENITV